MDFRSNNHLIQVITSPELLEFGQQKRWIVINVTSNILRQIQEKCGIAESKRFYVTCPKGFLMEENLALAQLIQRYKGPYHVIPAQDVEEEMATDDDNKASKPPMNKTLVPQETSDMTTPINKTFAVQKRLWKTGESSGTESLGESSSMEETPIKNAETFKGKPASSSVSLLEQNSKNQEDKISVSSLMDSKASGNESAVISTLNKDKSIISEDDIWIPVSDIFPILIGITIRFEYQDEIYQVEVLSVTPDWITGRVIVSPHNDCEKGMRVEFQYALMENIERMRDSEPAILFTL